jgi:hypothetical protein
MSKTKTTTVGGTPTSPAASQYTSWMQNMLGGGAYTGAINNLLSGTIGDPLSLTQQFQQMGQQGGAQLSPVDYFSQPFATTQFNQPALSNQQMPSWMGTQFQQPSLFNTPFQNTQFQQAQPFNASQFIPQFQQAPLANGQYNNQQWQNPALINSIQTSAGGLDPNSAYSKAIQQMVSNQQQQDVAALRERFTGTGGSQGTPAAYAESNLRAQAAPQLIAAMEQANQAERGLNLQQMGLANQATLGQNSILAQLGQAQNQFNQGEAQFGANFGLQQTGLNADIFNQMNQFGLQGGQLGLQGAGLNADIINQMNQLGLQQGLAGNQFNLQGAGLNADIMNQMNQLFNQQGLAQNQFNQSGAQLGMQQTGMNADIMNQLNQLMLSQSGQQNQFNQQNAAQMLQAAMANQSNALQNQQLMNQYGLGMGNLYQGFAGLNQQGQLGAINPLMQQYSQLLGLGTPQAQTVQQNTGFGNFMNFATDLTGMAANLSGIPGLGSAFSSLNPFGGRTQPTMTAPTQFNPYGSLFGSNPMQYYPRLF